MCFCSSSAHLRRSVWNSLGGRACRVSMGWRAPSRECSEHVKKILQQTSLLTCLRLSSFAFTGFTSWTSSWGSQWLTLSWKSDVLNNVSCFVELINMQLETVSNPWDGRQSGCQDSGEPSEIQIGFCYVGYISTYLSCLGRVIRDCLESIGFWTKIRELGQMVIPWLFVSYIHTCDGAIFFCFHDSGTLMVPCSHVFMDFYKFGGCIYIMSVQNASCSLSLLRLPTAQRRH